jgi:hypothetical protein
MFVRVLVLLLLQLATCPSWADDEQKVPESIVPRWTPGVLDMIRSGERAYVCEDIGVVGWDSPPDGSLYFFRNSTRENICIFGGCSFNGRKIENEICRQQCPPPEWVAAGCDTQLRNHRISLRPDIDEKRARWEAFTAAGCVPRQQRAMLCDLSVSETSQGWWIDVHYVGGQDEWTRSVYGKRNGVRVLIGRKGQTIELHTIP